MNGAMIISIKGLANSSSRVSDFVKRNPGARIVFTEEADAKQVAEQFSQEFPESVGTVLHVMIDSQGGEGMVGIPERPKLHVFLDPKSQRVLGVKEYVPA